MIDLFASIGSTTIATCVFYPAQRVKIQMQIDKNNSNISQSIIKIYLQNGISGFYQGLTSLIIGNGLSYSIYFVVYGKIRVYLNIQQMSTLNSIKCSSISGIISSITTNPFWVLQTRQAHNKRSMLGELKHIIKYEGLLSLWKGLLASLVLVSNPIIQFVIYEALKKTININKHSKLYDVIIFIIGAFSKIISTLVTYPLTLLRSRQHVSNTNESMLKIFIDIIRNQRLVSLYSGFKPKIIQTVLNSALVLMLYERIRLTLYSYNS